MNILRDGALQQPIASARASDSHRDGDAAKRDECILLAALGMAAVVLSTLVPDAPQRIAPARVSQGMATQRLQPSSITPRPLPAQPQDPFEPYLD
jgi:hypothetical protein